LSVPSSPASTATIILGAGSKIAIDGLALMKRSYPAPGTVELVSRHP
jgi:hypothetical protein